MLKFKLTSDVDGIVTYCYYPEGDRHAPGYASMAVSTGEVISYTYSTRDKSGKYIGHLISCMDSMRMGGEFDDAGTVAWC